MIIDAHIHMFRPEMMPDADPDYLKKLSGTYASYGAYIRLCFTPTRYNHTRQGWVTCERMVDIMDEEGIDKVTVLGPEDEYLAQCYRKFPDRLIPFIRVSMPDLRADIKAELQRMRHYIVDEGFFGFGEFHPDIAGYDLYAPEILAVMELAQELKVPVNVHVSEPVGHFYYGKSHNPLEEYYWLAKRYPDLKLMLAHWGGGLAFYEAIPEVRAALKNVTYDTAASKLFFDVKKSMEQITQIVDPRKIFYGSDYPLLLHPAEHPDEMNPRFVWDRDDFLQAGVPADVMNGIMGDNFAQYLDLAPSAPASGARPPAAAQALTGHGHAYAAAGPITRDMSIMMVAKEYPATIPVFQKHGLPWRDQRVPAWMGLIQPLAQRNVWFEGEFIQELRAALPAGDPLHQLDDLALVHEKTRDLAARYPAVKALIEKYDVPAMDSPLPPWEPIDQAAAAHGVWPVDGLLAELNAAVAAGGRP
jgi:predicted TIM-barrel fold metal-dependent hydrolase